MSSANILAMKLVEAMIKVITPANGPKPKILTKKMAMMISWKVRDSTTIKRAAR